MRKNAGCSGRIPGISSGACTGRTCRTGDAGEMKPPRIPPMLSTIVQAGLVAVDSATFGELAACPACGGPVSGYDTRKKVFAVVRENDGNAPSG